MVRHLNLLRNEKSILRASVSKVPTLKGIPREFLKVETTLKAFQDAPFIFFNGSHEQGISPLPFGVMRRTRSSTVTLFLPLFLVKALKNTRERMIH